MSHSSHTAEQHGPHVIPMWVYLGIGATLLVLTGVTVGVAEVDFGHLLGIPHLNIVVAMLIATFKALLVAFFFMHLFYDNKIYSLVFVVSLICLGIFLGLTMLDTSRRADLYEIEGQKIHKRASMYDTMKPATSGEGEGHAGH